MQLTHGQIAPLTTIANIEVTDEAGTPDGRHGSSSDVQFSPAAIPQSKAENAEREQQADGHSCRK
jgi:hypothetical protein